MPDKRILITASTLPRWEGDIEPEFILQLAEQLSGEFSITVLAPHFASAAREETIGRVKIHRFRYAPERWETLAYSGGMLHKLKSQPLHWLLVPLFLGAQFLAARSLHRRHRFDLIHAHWIVPQGLVAALLKLTGVFRGPLILTSHGGDLFSLAGPVLSRIKQWVLRHFDLINVVSNAMREPCLELGVPADKILVRSMGVDLNDRFTLESPAPERKGIVFVGRLVEKKGVDVLIRAFAALLGKFPEQRLTLLGHGPLRGALEALCVELGCEQQVQFTGAVKNEEVPRYLNAAAIAVVPSVVAADGDQEGLGLVAVEAMGCGCAMIVSDLPALRDVVESDVSGLMVTPGDPAALQQALARLLQDPNLCQQLASAAHTRVEQFSWPTAAAEFARQYRRLTG